MRRKEQTCRECGCTEKDRSICIQATGHSCWWIEEDLCSRCCKRPPYDGDPVGAHKLAEEIRILEQEYRLCGEMFHDLYQVMQVLEGRRDDPFWKETFSKARALEGRYEDWDTQFEERIEVLCGKLLEQEHGLKIGQTFQGVPSRFRVENVRLHDGKYWIQGPIYRKDGKLGSIRGIATLPHRASLKGSEELDELDKIEIEYRRKQREEERKKEELRGAELLRERFGLDVGMDMKYTEGPFGPGRLCIESARPSWDI